MAAPKTSPHRTALTFHKLYMSVKKGWREGVSGGAPVLVSERNPSFVLMQTVFLSVDVGEQRGLRGEGPGSIYILNLGGAQKTEEKTEKDVSEFRKDCFVLTVF